MFNFFSLRTHSTILDLHFQTEYNINNFLKRNTTCNEDSSMDMYVCQGEVVKERLEEFHASWSSLEIKQESGHANRARQIHEFVEEDFHVGRLIGRGGFADVIRVYSKSSIVNRAEGGNAESGQDFALKRLKSSTIENQTMRTVAASDFAMETTLLSHLDHVNIITLRFKVSRAET